MEHFSLICYFTEIVAPSLVTNLAMFSGMVLFRQARWHALIGCTWLATRAIAWIDVVKFSSVLILPHQDSEMIYYISTL